MWVVNFLNWLSADTVVSQKHTSRHAMAGWLLSGQRRFVPRASTTVNYKFVPPGTKKWRASHEGACISAELRKVASLPRKRWKKVARKACKPRQKVVILLRN
jgi:hypothetical protein